MDEFALDKIPVKTNIETRPAKLVDIESLIHTIRGKQVMLDSDFAMLYGAETKVFNHAVKRNERRFLDHFRFRLTDKEYTSLRSRSVTSKERGGKRYLPCAFTEQGVAMLSAVIVICNSVIRGVITIVCGAFIRRIIAGICDAIMPVSVASSSSVI